MGIIGIIGAIANQVSATLDDFTYLFRGEAENAARNKVTAVGDAQVDGSNVLVLDGNDYVTIPDSDDWYPNGGDFVMDGWVKFDTFAPGQIVWGQYQDSNHFIWIRYSGAAWNFIVKNGSGTDVQLDFTDAGGTTGVWYHWALVKSGDDYILYRDFVKKATNTSSTFSSRWVNFLGPFEIGRGWNGTFNYMTGEQARFRIRKGTDAGWTGATIPTIDRGDPIPESSDNVLALNFDGDAASTRIIDSAVPDDGATPGLLPDISGNEADLTPTGAGITYNDTPKTLSFNGVDYVSTPSFVNAPGTVYTKSNISASASLQAIFGDTNVSGGFTSDEYLYGYAGGTLLNDTTDHSGVEHTFAFDFINSKLYVDGAEVASGSMGSDSFASLAWGSNGSNIATAESKNLFITDSAYDATLNSLIMGA